MEVVTINILVKHQPLNEEQVRDERLVLLLPEELVGFAEERREVKRSKKTDKQPSVPNRTLHLYVY